MLAKMSYEAVVARIRQTGILAMIGRFFAGLLTSSRRMALTGEPIERDTTQGYEYNNK